MFVFKDINKTSTVIQQNVVNYTQNLSASADGINSIKIVSGSTNVKYWNSLNVLFYTSGSPRYSEESLKYASSDTNLSIQNIGKKQFLSKYHGYPNSTLIIIPSQYYGEKIEENTFQIKDLNNTSNGGDNPIIKDDGAGNLYATNAHHSQSTTNASSSDNYVGNIFYDKGLAIITETGSWSGSVKYSDLGTNYNLKFDSHNTITTYEYNLTIQPNEYNYSTNYSLRSPISGSLNLGTKYLSTIATGSDFSPYITTLNLYNEDDLFNPVIQAKLPKPIRKSKKITTTFKVRIDI
tara:strand:- start:35 stop:913 length:879 start_codon:yes stop_codon:yes gene_type:complete